MGSRTVKSSSPGASGIACPMISVGRAGVELEVARGHLDVGPCLAQGLAVVLAFERRQLLGPIAHALRNP